MAKEGKAPQKFDPVIVEGPIHHAVRKLALPSMIQNVVAGLQGIVDHVLIGNLVGHTGNAAVGVSWQIFLVVIVFVGSIFTGMGILVARFAGAGDASKVNRVFYQGFLTAVFVTAVVLIPAGLVLTPFLLNLVNAAPEVQIEALPYLRTIFVFSLGMLLYYLLAGALRASGDARTPLRLGLLMTSLNLLLSPALISGIGPLPAFGTLGAAMGTVIASSIASAIGAYLLLSDSLTIRLEKGRSWKPDWGIIRQLFKFGLPSGFQAVAMNLGGVLLYRFVGSLKFSAEAHSVYAICYTQLFSLVTWTSSGLMGATSAIVGQNLGAGKPWRAKRGALSGGLAGVSLAFFIALIFVLFPRTLLGLFGRSEPLILEMGVQFLLFLSLSGIFVTLALNYTGALQGAGDTRSPMFITVISQLIVPPGLLLIVQNTVGLQPIHVWSAVLMGHFLRCVLSIGRFYQGRWAKIRVQIDD